MAELKPPILVIGASRSGTSMLINLLSQADNVCRWYEPNTLWCIGRAYKSVDNATAEDAKPWIIRSIRRAFLEYQRAHEDHRVIEKTPNNVVRIGFVHRVLPEAKIVYIYRDGRANIRSQIEIKRTFQAYGIDQRQVQRHIMGRLRITPWWEWPAYIPRALSSFVHVQILGKQVPWFGLRYRGWKKDRKRLTSPQIAAKQWVIAVETALSDLEKLPRASWLGIRYEDVVAAPRTWFERINEFCGLEVNDAYWEKISKSVRPEPKERWVNELDTRDLAEAMPILERSLKRLRYLN